MNYTHRTHHKAKNLTIKIDDEGQVIVVTPRWYPKRKIDRFIEEKRDWIEKSLSKINSTKKIIDSKTEIMIFGKKYSKEIVSDDSFAGGISLMDNKFIINQITAEESLYTSRKINRFLKNTAEKYLLPRTHQIGKHMKINFGNITLREQKSRWGSCSSLGNLNFNWRLVHHPTVVIDYVIVHELAHRIHLDHSSNFWSLVEKYHPDYRIHRGWLKRRGRVW